MGGILLLLTAANAHIPLCQVNMPDNCLTETLIGAARNAGLGIRLLYTYRAGYTSRVALALLHLSYFL
jgi:hypothetical protein